MGHEIWHDIDPAAREVAFFFLAEDAGKTATAWHGDDSHEVSISSDVGMAVFKRPAGATKATVDLATRTVRFA